MKKTYVRLVELFVKSDLRDEIKQLKKHQTYDQFIRDLIKKNNGSSYQRTQVHQSLKKGDSNVN